MTHYSTVSVLARSLKPTVLIWSILVVLIVLGLRFTAHLLRQPSGWYLQHEPRLKFWMSHLEWVLQSRQFHSHLPLLYKGGECVIPGEYIIQNVYILWFNTIAAAHASWDLEAGQMGHLVPLWPPSSHCCHYLAPNTDWLWTAAPYSSSIVILQWWGLCE